MANQEKRQPTSEPSTPSNRKIRVGIVGCGEVTQIMQWPSLFRLADQFAVTALCDVPFVEEWKAFYKNVTKNTVPKTDPADFAQDLELFTEMARRMS
jgi:hypothetical protein